MNKLMLVVCAAMVVGMAGLVHAAAPAAEQPAEDEKMLFNGRDLDGWTWVSSREGVAQEDVWSVQEGGVLRTTGQPNGYLRTNDDVASFRLRFQIRHIEPGNTGVLFRLVGPDRVWPRCIEAQGQSGSLGDIINLGNFAMTTDPQRTRGRMIRKMHESNERPIGEWNDYEVIMDGPELTILVNGLVQNVASDVEVVAGTIGFQSEGRPVEFRDIRLTVLEGTGEVARAARAPEAPAAAPTGE